MFEDLCAIRQTLKLCLMLRENPYLRHWYTVLDQRLPLSQPGFEESVNGSQE